MKILGIDFVPLNTPLQTHLETLSAAAFVMLTVGLMLSGPLITLYVLFFTSYWYLSCIYLFWIFVIDNEIGEKGGRLSEWVRSWTLFKYFKNYFPITVESVPGFKVDPNKNYMACVFPHGLLPFGTMAIFLTNAFEETRQMFPHHKIYATTLNNNIFIPLYRDFALAMGICSTTEKSLKYQLDPSNGALVTGVVVGGSAEAHYCHSEEYKLVLKNRKGFIKVALRNGSPIIPVFCFGQNNNYKQVVFSKGSLLRRVQTTLEKHTGMSFLAFYGRGFLQKTFGFIPFNSPMNAVVGIPIDLPKIENPTQEDIDKYHSIFIEKLTEIFDEYKYKFEKHPEKATLTLV